jgi:nucleoside-diphosphate-sugar epimerase
MQHILVTGGAGRLGRLVVKHLSAAGYRVRGLSRRASPGDDWPVAPHDSGCKEPHDTWSLGTPALVDGVWPDAHAVHLARRLLLADAHCAAIGRPLIDRFARLPSLPLRARGGPLA